MLKHYGYVELRPPSLLLKPGTLVYVRDDDPFVAGVICDTDASMGPTYLSKRSPTAEMELRQLDGAKMTLGADVLSALHADARLEMVHTVEATLTNAQVLEINDEEVLTHLAARTLTCGYAVAHRLAKNFPVTMISSALMGDVVYKIVWRKGAELSAGTRAIALKALSGQLGGDHVDESTITAKGLVWGIRDDRYLAGLSIPTVDETSIPRGARALPAKNTKAAAVVEDARH